MRKLITVVIGVVVVAALFWLLHGCNPPGKTPEPIPVGETNWQLTIVEAGETLGVIAKKLGTTVDELASKNSISDPNKIGTGQGLLVPLKETEPGIVAGILCALHDKWKVLDQTSWIPFAECRVSDP